LPECLQWWRFKYRIDGKEKRISLGVYPDVGLADARDKREQAPEPANERRQKPAPAAPAENASAPGTPHGNQSADRREGTGAIRP